jgi:cytochrome P450
MSVQPPIVSPPLPPSEENYDPFEEFNRVQGRSAVRNPYPQFGELRSRCPVQKIDLRQLLGNEVPIPPDVVLEVYAALNHEAASEVLRDPHRFTSRGYAMSMGQVFGHSILEMDPPEHTRYRALIQHAFTKRALDRWEHELVGPVVHGLIDRFIERGNADLVRELTFPFPVAVIAGMIGVPKERHHNFHRWAVELISVQFAPERGMAASEKLGKLFAEILADRRKQARDDLISVLAHAEIDGSKLSDEDIFAFLRLLAPAGAETTYRSSSNLLLALLTHPPQLDALRQDRLLIPQAIDEGLRWECPLTGIMRIATQETEVAGARLPAGALVNVNLGSANHDDARYEGPERFDIFRPRKQHLAFASGPHTCLGMHLALMETRVVLEAVLDRLPNLRLDSAAQDIHIGGVIFRSPAALPVQFDAGKARA